MAIFTRIEQPGSLAVDDSETALATYEDDFVEAVEHWRRVRSQSRGGGLWGVSHRMLMMMNESKRVLGAPYVWPGVAEIHRQRLLRGLAMTMLWQRLHESPTRPGHIIPVGSEAVYDFEEDDTPESTQSYRLHVARSYVEDCFEEVMTNETAWYEGGGLYVEGQEPAVISGTALTLIRSRGIRLAPNLVTLEAFLPPERT